MTSKGAKMEGPVPAIVKELLEENSKDIQMANEAVTQEIIWKLTAIKLAQQIWSSPNGGGDWEAQMNAVKADVEKGLKK